MKFAIVFSVENKAENNPAGENSSAFERMAMGLAFSIRQYMPDVDVYCGTFTNNTLSQRARKWFDQYNVQVVEDKVFDNITASDSYMFLRTFTKDYFAKKLLDKYDYLVSLDIDVVALNKFEFDFDPTSPVALVETMPPWVHNYHGRHLTDFKGNLYYNWVDVINKHNQHVFALDWTDPYVLHEHNADKIISNNIDSSNLTVIEQDVGGYHCFKPVKPNHLVYHYDAFTEGGSLYNLKKVFPTELRKYTWLFENILNIKITNKENFWEDIVKEYS